MLVSVNFMIGAIHKMCKVVITMGCRSQVVAFMGGLIVCMV